MQKWSWKHIYLSSDVANITDHLFPLPGFNMEFKKQTTVLHVIVVIVVNRVTFNLFVVSMFVG